MSKFGYYKLTATHHTGRLPTPWWVTYYSPHPDGIHMIPHDLGCYEWEHQAIEARNQHLLARFNAGEKVQAN